MGCREHSPAEESPLSFVRHSCCPPGQTQFCRERSCQTSEQPAVSALHLAGVTWAPPNTTAPPASGEPSLALSLSLQRRLCDQSLSHHHSSIVQSSCCHSEIPKGS